MTLLDKAIFRDDLRQGVDWNVNNEAKVNHMTQQAPNLLMDRV